ncbi:DUF4349 domain-containing protein [Pedobacter psychroterrae]|nr:DUF4349 domain-containing protein [Pedobacter psychroterrae]
MKRSIIAIAAAVAVMLYGCNNEKSADYQESEQVANASLETGDTTVTEKIIKTAEIRFRVKNARQTKKEISDQLKKLGGKLVESDMQSNIQKSEKVKYSADSLLEITAYKTEGKIIAKVPSAMLDEFTDFVAEKAYFVDYQSLKFDDSSVSYLGNKIKADNRVAAINSLNKQANKKSGNVETSLYIKDDYVDQKIKNLLIDEQVKFSTITLNFYQDNTISRLVVGNDNLYDYRPGFFQRMGLNFVTGWTIFQEMILIAVNLWMLILVAALIYFGIVYYRKHRRLLSGRGMV